MTSRIKSAASLGVAVTLLAIIPAVLAHGEGMGGRDMEMDMGHGHGHGHEHGEPAPSPSHDAYPENYFSHPELQGVLYAHIALMVLAWVVVLPVAVMFSIARSRYTLVSQLLFGTVNGVGLILGMMYNEGTPDLYPGNAHHKLGWVISAISCAQMGVGVLARLAGAFGRGTSRSWGGKGVAAVNHDDAAAAARGLSSFIPVSVEAMAEHHQRTSGHPAAHKSHGPYRFSHDSGQGTEPNTESLRSPTFSASSFASSSSSRHHDEDVAATAAAHKEEGLRLLRYGNDGYGSDDDDDDNDEEERDVHKDGASPSLAQRLDTALGCGVAGRVYRVARRAAGAVSAGAWRVLVLGYNVVDRAILVLGFVALCTGVATQGRLFEGHEIFSGLAHWIKGGVFFWLGLVTLGRWTGAFGDLGWAWNVRPGGGKQQQKWRPSAEFVESALIFFYGSTNIFLEHLGSSSQGVSTWSAQDLEHVSITVLFIGGGLCGMLIESALVRDLLNTSVVEAAAGAEGQGSEGAAAQLAPPRQYGVSLNPIPALVILLLGIMMSSHTQASMVSSMVHKQWGTLLTGASMARALTYVLMYLKPPRSVLPSRPPTELLASFGLSAGGIIFMASSGDTVTAMTNQELDPMFMYTVTMGLVALLMAWVVIVMAIKGWAVRRELARSAGSHGSV